MRNVLTYIRRSLSLQLSLWLLLFAVTIFIVSLGFLFLQSRASVKDEAVQRATQALYSTVLRVQYIMNEVETATNNTDWLVRENLDSESIFTYSRKIVEANPDINGCSISFEPFFFGDSIEFFSAYSGHEADSIVTEQEGSTEYNYFNMPWYTKAKERGEACWVDPFYDDYDDTSQADGMISSYSKPLTDKDGKFIGVIATDLSLTWLSQIISAEKPYTHSYSILTGHDGTFFVHPDTARIVAQTIFTGADPEENADIIQLGKDMIGGKTGMQQARIDGEDCLVFYRPLPHTECSVAIVCLESDIFASYNRLFYIVLPIIVIGLLLMLLLCHKIVNHAVVPLNQLARQSHRIAAGHFDETMPESPRVDAVGQLQNSFGAMQTSFAGYINKINSMNAEIEQRNAELQRANELAKEAGRKKTAFMQDVTHQIRTPLNIITGFSQVLQCDAESVSEEEKAIITDAMQENAKSIINIINMLIDASKLDATPVIARGDEVSCNELCREVIKSAKPKHPEDVTMEMKSLLPDTYTFRTNKEHVTKVLKELVENANKFTHSGSITLSCDLGENGTVRFAVTDTGIGIPEEKQELVFMQFTKLDDFTDGIGLGLTLCRRVARMMGGDVLLDTSYTEGTRIVLTLPR